MPMTDSTAITNPKANAEAIDFIITPTDLIKPQVQLTGEDGNAFYIIGIVRKALRKAGNSRETVTAFTDQATNSDYGHLLAVCDAFADIS